MAMKQLNPDYVGFRGYGEDSVSSEPPLEKVTCSKCQRVRNVPVGVAVDRQDDYVCATCQEEIDQDLAEEADTKEAADTEDSPA